MKDGEESELAGTKQPLIISPEQAAERMRTKGVADGGKQGKHAISRAEAVSIAVQIGQQVYDQLRKEHADAMHQLQQDLSGHLGSIRKVTAINILDIQRRSFSYRLRRDFAVDRMIFRAWLREKWETLFAWLELHGLYSPIAEPRNPQDSGPPTWSSIPDEPQHVGAPTELPEAPEVARTLVLSDGGPDVTPE